MYRYVSLLTPYLTFTLPYTPGLIGKPGPPGVPVCTHLTLPYLTLPLPYTPGLMVNQDHQVYRYVSLLTPYLTLP